jgi:signal transduction histidine kinase
MTMYKFNPYSIPTFLTAIFLFCLGLFVFLKNKRSEVNFSFLLLCLSASIWQFGYTFVFMSTASENALFWQKVVYLGVPFLTPAIYHFSVAFLKLQKQRKNILIFYIIGFIFIFISTTTNLLISGLNKYFWGFYKKAGPLYTLFLILWFIPGVYGVYNLYRGYIKFTNPLGRQRRKYMFIALTIVFIALWDFIPAYGIELYPFGYVGVIACLSVIAYAIVKYRLMDIAVAITRTTIFVVLFSLVLGLPFLFVAAGKQWLIKVLGVNWWIGPTGLMAALGTSGPFIFFYIEKRAVAILLREQRRYQETLRHAAVDMTRIRNLQKLLDFIISLFNDAVRITHSAIYLFDAKTDDFLLKASLNLKKEQPDAISKKDPLIVWLGEHKEPLVYEEIKQKSENSPDSLFKRLEEQIRSLNATVIVPCILEGKLLDILILGDKLSGRIYTSEDLDNFSELCREVALATENALLYGNIEEEVRQRTKQLVEVQNQLVQAEKLATMGTLAGGVAHEINNPLTAILTNAQMLLTDAKSFDADSKESLQLIEEATQRCRTIVQKLMTYAKRPLETAEVSKVDLLNVVKKAISFLGYQFEQENIKIILSAKDEVYPINGNQNELEQLLTNIILNARDAITKTKKSGNIYISLSKSNNSVYIEVKDEGSGIPKEIMPRIFDPFFTTKDVGKGLGLGLSICQAIIEKHKGTITVQSEVNKGSVFTIKIPRTEVTSVIKEA